MTYTLVADGTSDAVLIAILTWLLRAHDMAPINPQWFDLTRVPRQPSLGQKLRVALELYPCDVLFVHRDAERDQFDVRRREIEEAAIDLGTPHIPVVPVRMTEAWLLSSESAIREDSGEGER